MAQKKA
jgi:hypothetical protein